jgi:hypothetical protein
MRSRRTVVLVVAASIAALAAVAALTLPRLDRAPSPTGQGSGPSAEPSDPALEQPGDAGVPPPPPPPAPPAVPLDPPAFATAARAQLETGTILYLVPPRMRVREASRVLARISAGSGDAAAGELGQNLPPAEADPVVEPLPVGWEMKAEPKADPEEFAVTELGDPRKLLPETGHREWRWQVVPKAAGTHTLVLVTTVMFDGVDQADRHWERAIRVAVNPRHWLATNWGQVLGALGVTGVGSVSYLRSRLRRRGRGPLWRAGVAFGRHDRYPPAA